MVDSKPAPDDSPDSRKARKRSLRLAVVAVIVVWTLAYNLLIKRQGIGPAFFGILDTISDDFVMGTTLTVGVGVGIVVVFSITKLYTQIISNVHSFRILEELLFVEIRERKWRVFFRKLMHFEELPLPESTCPKRVSSVILAMSFIYLMSWVYVILFSEALFFVSWSAGVNLKIDPENPEFVLLTLPMLALAIPFSARVMAYVRYPYAQDYADFMPGAVFVLLLVSSLGILFSSPDQVVFLDQIWQSADDPELPNYLLPFLRNGAFLAFIPVFFEGAFWLWELSKEEPEEEQQVVESPPAGD